MAMMEALLKIRADVQGEGRINALGKALGGLNNTAKQVGGGLSNLANSLGGLGGPLGSLAGLATGAGLAALAKNAIDTADNLRDMSIRTGVSVEMLSKLKTAAEMSGATIDDVGKALTRTAAAIANAPSAAANTATNALTAGTNNLRLGIQQQVELIQQRERQQVDAIKNGAQRQIQEVQNRERQQIDAIDRAAEQRINRLERETDARLREINRRYRQEEKLLNDSYDDARDRAQQAADDELRVLERRIERRYDAQRKAIQADKSLSDSAKDAQLQTLQDQQEDELKVLRDGYSEKAKIRDRQFRDQQERDQQAIDDRKRTEEEAEKARTEALKKAVNDRAKAEKEAVSRASADSQKLIRANADAMVKSIQDGNKRAQDAYSKLGVALRNADGSARKPGEVFLDLFDALRKLPNDMERAAAVIDVYGAKLGPKLLPMFAMPREEIEKLAATITTDFANAADRFNDKQTEISSGFLKLGVGIGQVLLPVVEVLAGALNGIVGVLSSLPEPIKSFLVSLGLIGLAVKPLMAFFGVMSGLKLGALIAGWAPVIVAGMAQITAAITIATSAIISILGGILTWVGGTLIPGLLAVFSGPVGWTVLAVAAVVAMVIAFRKPLGEFLMWLWQWSEPFRQFWVDVWNAAPQAASNALVSMQKAFTGLGSWMAGIWSSISKGFSQYVVQPISNAWNALIQALPSAMAKGVQFVQNTWTGMINAIRGALRGFLVSIANAVNAVVGVVNRVIGGFNNLPGPDIPFVPTLQVPQFAKGGVVNRATLAMVGEGGEREYIVPESKMGRVSAAYLSGSRGAQVFKQSQSLMRAPLRRMPQSATLTNRPISINVKTGPVMEFQGERYVKLEELDRAMRITAEGVMGRLRTPAARVALGIR